VSIAHFDDARSFELELGHLRGRWSLLGEAAGCVDLGVRRIQVPAGGWSTPAHEHGRQEEIFYVLAGEGLSWQGGAAAPIRAGDCIVYHPRRGAHSVHATRDLDVLAFGPREYDEAPRFPRLGMALVGGGMIETTPSSINRTAAQFVHESKLGAPELPAELSERPGSIVNGDDVEPAPFGRGTVRSLRRDLGRAAGARRTGMKHVEVAPGKDATPQHCHSLEEEIFVILEGDGSLLLGADRDPIAPGHVISRPAGTGVAHQFRAGARGLQFLAYGMREPGDMCYYPRSNKVSFRGLGVIGRIERLDYWDGED
jgi:uncharacterized cupin superfamily protein